MSGDASASTYADQADVDEQIGLVFDREHEQVVWDLRHQNEWYGVFWDKCEEYIDSQLETAVDDHQCDHVIHMGLPCQFQA